MLRFERSFARPSNVLALYLPSLITLTRARACSLAHHALYSVDACRNIRVSKALRLDIRRWIAPRRQAWLTRPSCIDGVLSRRAEPCVRVNLGSQLSRANEPTASGSDIVATASQPCTPCTSGKRTAMSPLCVIYRTHGNEGYCSYILSASRSALGSTFKGRLTFGSMIFRYRT